MARVDYYLGKCMETLMLVSLFLTVAVTLAQVIFRYVLGSSLAWSQELALIGFVYSVLFGAVVCLKNNDHLQVDLLDNAPLWMQKLSSIMEFTIITIFILVLLYFGFQLFLNNLISGQVVGILPVQKAYVYLALPLSAVFMLYFHIRKVMT